MKKLILSVVTYALSELTSSATRVADICAARPRMVRVRIAAPLINCRARRSLLTQWLATHRVASRLRYAIGLLTVFLSLLLTAPTAFAQPADITADELRNKIRGAIIGQFFGNLNGLNYEFKYNEQPGSLTSYTPDLSEGAHTDDDTDIEFPYIYNMKRSEKIYLPYSQVSDIWIRSINDRIWCSNRYARYMMNLGIQPPHTGRIALNPWADFNISGQFLCESFGVISPGMPQTAGRIGTHYTQVAIDGEPVQATLFFDAVLASAFFESDVMKLVQSGLDSMDEASEQQAIISNVIRWHRQNGDNWRATRQSIKDTYWNGKYGDPGGSNGYRVTTASTVAALLHGEGKFVETLTLAFNFGWDADNTAAMVGTILGVTHGEQWLRSQGWKIKDVYRNTHRPGLPTDLTISSFADMHVDVARKVILSGGGKEIEIDGQAGYRIVRQKPANVVVLPQPLHRGGTIRKAWLPKIEEDLTGSLTQKLRAVYIAAALGLVPEIVAKHPQEWKAALDAYEVPTGSDSPGAIGVDPNATPHQTLHWLTNNKMWSSKAKAYFEDVIVNRNLDPTYPFEL